MPANAKDKKYGQKLLGIAQDFVKTATDAILSVVPDEQRHQVVNAVESTAKEARDRMAAAMEETGSTISRLGRNVRGSKPAAKPSKKSSKKAAKKAAKKKASRRSKAKKKK